MKKSELKKLIKEVISEIHPSDPYDYSYIPYVVSEIFSESMQSANAKRAIKKEFGGTVEIGRISFPANNSITVEFTITDPHVGTKKTVNYNWKPTKKK